ncbi:MAG TPA: hypothetical protein VFW65_03480 [Pseudonocardiaceae bacterium]|nr:hypothetical protein [Pseudonocardiaceae bacterium]
MGEPGVRTARVDVAPDFIAYCRAEGLTHQASGLRYAATTFTDPVDATDHVYVVPLDPEIEQRPDVLAGLMTRFAPQPLLVRTRPAATGPAAAGLIRSIAYLVLDHLPTIDARFRVRDADGVDDVAFVTDLLERSYTEGYAALGTRAADQARDYVAELGVGTDALRSLVVTDDTGRRLGHLTAVEDVCDEVTELDCDEVVDVMFADKPPSGAETSLVAAAVRRSIATGRVLLGRVTYDHPRGPRIERKLLDDGWQPFYDVWSNRQAEVRVTS